MLRPLTVTVALTLPLVVQAAAFPDVPETFPYAKAIAALHELGVVEGNPDGTFAPAREVNRAEILTMLYRASGRAPRSVFGRCFPDVGENSWYEGVVCDAAHERFIDGNPDGSFRPEMSVNRVEGLKMVLNVLGFTTPALTQGDRLGLDFLKVSHSSWYASYLHRALALRIVPEALTIENEFDPGFPLNRGEVAEIIYRALSTEDFIEVVGEEEREEGRREEDEAEEREPSGYVEVEVKPPEAVDFPFHRSGTTGGRGSAAYTFTLAEPTTALFEARNLTSPSAGISCFLYELNESGLPDTIYVGFQEEGSCRIRARASAGNHQYEVRTGASGSEYAADAEQSTGDGNDGPVEAIELRVGFPRTAQLRAGDYEDWFHFKVGAVGTYRVNLTPVEDLLCTIHPRSNVDVFGFEGPQCGQTTEFQPGDYDVSVQRLSPPSSKAYTYTVDVR